MKKSDMQSVQRWVDRQKEAKYVRQPSTIAEVAALVVYLQLCTVHGISGDHKKIDAAPSKDASIP